MIFLRSVEMRSSKEHEAAGFPFSLDVLRSLREIVFPAPVTFFVGDNGSGKSTILSFDAGKIHAVRYDELEHVNLIRDFVNRPESFLRHL